MSILTKALRDLERVKRYRRAFPEDRRDAPAILAELNDERRERKKAIAWLERNIGRSKS